MKYLVNLKLASALVGGVLISMLCGCDDADYKVIDNAVYLSEAYSNPGLSKKISIDTESSIAVTATVRATQTVAQDTKATLGVDEQALDTYNKKNGTNYILLPTDKYSFSEKEVTIQAGKVSAGVASITIQPMTQEMLASGNKYSLPISIMHTDGNLLESMQNMIYLMDPVIITSVPVLTGSTPAKLNMTKDYNVTQWSVEFRVNMSILGTEVGEYNNQALFSANPSSGKAEDGEIYIRFGDAPIAGNILQVKTQGTQINCPTPFNAKQWYHLAFVCNGPTLTIYVDGKVEATLDLPNKPLSLDRNNFGICGGGSYLVADVMMSELRFWTTAISQSQIQNNMYTINPQTEGLEGYWKLNEGDGSTFNDATGHGNTGVATNGVVRWEHGIRSDGK